MGFVRNLTGANQSKAVDRATDIQAEAGREALIAQQQATANAQGFFEPFAGVAERGVQESGFLANPQAQFDFLQGNPLFQLALDNANQQTQASAASRGRLSAGDTLQQLSNNVLLSASPLIDRQRSDILSLLTLGEGVASSQANIETGQAAKASDLSTDIAAAQAAGQIGAAQAKTSGAQNLLGLGMFAAGRIGAGFDAANQV
jgi:hypothetical protein